MLPSGFLGYPWAELIVITGGNKLMENYRKVHLREVLINNTSRLRYSAQPEECGLSHSRWTEWESVPLSQAGKRLPQPPKAILDFRCNQRSRSTLKLKNSDKEKGETKSVWPIQLASLPDFVSASKLSTELQSLCSQSQSRKLHNLQMEEAEKRTTVESQPKCCHRQRDVIHTCKPEWKLIKIWAS